MSVRLGTTIGLPSESTRSPGSADVMFFHEPTIGSVLRTKGSLFVLAQVSGSDPALSRTAREAVEWLEREYYYDLSAGVLDSLRRAVKVINRRIYHVRQRPGMPASGGIGVIATVIRGREAHVVRLGTAGGVILRDGGAYELPPPPDAAEDEDPRVRKRHVAASLGDALEVEPFTWQGEIAAGDKLALLSRSLAEALGADELKRVLASLRPAAAATELQRLFASSGGIGSDGVLVVEIVERPVTVAAPRLEPVYPEQPLAGLPDESPIPLAEGVTALAEATRRRAERLRDAAARAALVWFRVVLGLMPHRGPRYPIRVAPAMAREASRRRRLGAAGMVSVAALAAVAAAVGGAGGPSPTDAIARSEIAREAIASAGESLREVERTIEGADLVDRSPEAADELLSAASRDLDRAQRAGVPEDALLPLQSRVDRGLDRLHGVSRLSEATRVFELAPPGGGGVADATRMVAATDGSLWIIDRLGERVLRADPASGSLEIVLQAGEERDGVTVAAPWLIATAATDVVVLDRSRQAWRLDLAERVARRMTLAGSETVDERASLLGALQHRPPLEIFNLYLVDPGTRSVLRWTPPAVIPVEFPDPPVSYLAEEPDVPVAAARDLRLDANLWLLHSNTVTRVNFGTPLTQLEYSLDRPPDAAVRPALDYRLLDAATVAGTEIFYVYDRANARIIGFNRSDGSFFRQWLAPRTGPAAGILDDVRGLVVAPLGDSAPAAFVLGRDSVVRVVLE